MSYLGAHFYENDNLIPYPAKVYIEKGKITNIEFDDFIIQNILEGNLTFNNGPTIHEVTLVNIKDNLFKFN